MSTDNPFTKISPEQLAGKSTEEVNELLLQYGWQLYQIQPAAVAYACGFPVQEKFDVLLFGLQNPNAHKIAVICELRKQLNISLQRAKELVDLAITHNPQVLISDCLKVSAEHLKFKLEDVGAKIYLR